MLTYAKEINDTNVFYLKDSSDAGAMLDAVDSQYCCHRGESNNKNAFRYTLRLCDNYCK